MTADAPEGDRLGQAIRRWHDALPVPDGLVDAITSTVARRRNRTAMARRLLGWAAVAFTSVGLGYAWTLRPRNATATVRLELASPRRPVAGVVTLIGDFNDWRRPGLAMHRDPVRGVWSAELRLPPGYYHYVYLVEGRGVMLDSLAPHVGDSLLGMANAMVVTTP